MRDRPHPDVLRVAVANTLSPALRERILAREPRIRFLVDDGLLPPMRFPADFAGDPAFVRSAAQQARFVELLHAADALYGIPDLSPAALRAVVEENAGLRWVHGMAAGAGAQIGAAGLSAEQLRRVAFTTSAGVHAEPLAEFALLGVLLGVKRVRELRHDQAARRWADTRRTLGMLSGSRVVVAGLGGIGRAVTATFAAVGAEVVGCSRRSTDAVPGLLRRFPFEDLAEELRVADALVVALPHTSRTAGSIGAHEWAAAKHGITVVNVGRGTALDEPALVSALESGRVGSAALDVFAVEPLPAESPLWAMPQVLVSPHTAALDPGEETRIADLFAANATLLLDGGRLRNLVDVEEFY